MVLVLNAFSQIFALSFRVSGKAFNLRSSISTVPSLKWRILPQTPICDCKGFHFPCHGMLGVEAPSKASLLLPQ